MSKKNLGRLKRATKNRSKIKMQDIHRLTIFRSSNHIYAQVIDDDRGHTLAAATSLEMKRDDTKTDVAKAVGEKIAKSALSAGITKVVFDRGGYKYHGRVKALADAARSEGLNF